MAAQYHSISSFETLVEDTSYSARLLKPESQTVRKRPSLLKQALHLLPKLLALLWLAPIVSLIYLNLTSHIIGSSAWCPYGRCVFDPFAANSSTIAKQYDRETHNLFGALQLAAKGLEVWFIIIASSFVYTVGVLLARRRAGLPLSLFVSHIEFSDIRYLLSPELWTSPKPLKNASQSAARNPGPILWAFVFFIACMCILSNLMGPAVAILLLPSQMKHQTARQQEKVFVAMESDAPPAGSSTIPLCTAELLASQDYWCAGFAYRDALDSWIASGKAYDSQVPYVVSRWPNGTNPATNLFASSQALFAVSQEWALTLAFNASSDEPVFWAPSRQVLRNLTGDLENYYEAVKGITEDRSPDKLQQYEDPVVSVITGRYGTQGFLPAPLDSSFKDLKNSLDTVLRRNGPVVGAEINFYQASNWHSTIVENDADQNVKRGILCAMGWSPFQAADAQWNATKCFQVGEGWPGGRNYDASYDYAVSIPLQNKKALLASADNVTLTFEMFWADRTAYFNDTWRAGVYEDFTKSGCLPDNSLEKQPTLPPSSCDWDSFFDPAGLEGLDDYPYVLRNVHLIYLQLYIPKSEENDEAILSTYIIEFSPSMAIAEYSLETSPLTNAMRLAQVENTPSSLDANGAHPIYIHPSWLAAMWGAYPNYDASIRIEDESRMSPYAANWSSGTLDIIQEIYEITDAYDNFQDLYAALHKPRLAGYWAVVDYRSLFYIGYLTTLHLCSILTFNTSDIGDTLQAQGPERIVLYRSASALVWAYVVDSRSSVFGVIVVCAGSVIVVLYFLLALATGVRVRGTTALLSASLRHAPRDEFTEHGTDERRLGRVRFTAHEDRDRLWKFRKVA